MEWNDDTRAWVDALESNDYGQARKTLWDGGTDFCCLGVAAHKLLGREKFQNRLGGWMLDCRVPGAVAPAWSAATLPYELRRRLTLTESDVGYAVEMNDLGGFSFKEIAQAIRYACDTHTTLRAGRDFVRDALRTA